MREKGLGQGRAFWGGASYVSRVCRKQSPDYKESAYERKVRLRKARGYGGYGKGSVAFANPDGDVECGAEEGRERGQL